MAATLALGGPQPPGEVRTSDGLGDTAAKCLSVVPSCRTHKCLVGLFCRPLLPVHDRGALRSALSTARGREPDDRQMSPRVCSCPRLSMLKSQPALQRGPSFKGELMRWVFTNSCSVVCDCQMDTKLNYFEIVFQVSNFI